MKSLAGLNIFMVGGTGGMGRATILRLAKPEMRFCVCASNAAKLEQLENQVREKGAETFFRAVDCTNPAQLRAFIDEGVARFGSADILINFAGLSIDATLETLTEEQWDTVLDVNLKGTYFAIQAFARNVDPAKGALVVNFSSMAATRPAGSNAQYAASKAGVTTLTKALANQMKSKNIMFTCMSPGPTKTSFFDGRKTEEQMASFMAAEDVAEILEFIMVHSDRIVFHEMMFDSYAFFRG